MARSCAIRHGVVVRCEVPARTIPLDRVRLATLPGQPPPDAPLVCLDTETTGLATAAGTVAFLVGLGWWVGDTFRQVQLLLPDHGDEPALLETLASHLPPDGWLVTYNGRGFDWPLLVARYRMNGRPAPVHAGHLDLLPIVRRMFRHRLGDARLRSAEAGLLGLHRHGDVDGWEIPGRYLGFLRGGPAEPLAAVVRHNDQDVRSLARLLGVLETGYATEAARRTAPAGDLAGLARAFARVGRLDESLGCLDAALAADPADPVRWPQPLAPTAEPSPRRAPSRRGAGGAVVVAPRPGRLRRRPDGARPCASSRPSAPPPSRPRGRASGSPSSGRTSSAGSAAGMRPTRRGRRSPPARGGPRSWPRSSSPSSASTGCAIPAARWPRPRPASPRRTGGRGSVVRSRDSRRTSGSAPGACRRRLASMGRSSPDDASGSGRDDA